MEIKIACLTLTTSSLFDMTNFFTQVLDLQVYAGEDHPFVWVGNLQIKLVEDNPPQLNNSSFLTLEIPEFDFELIVEKFTFFMFRKNMDAKNFYQIHHDGVSLKDLDGRVWKVIAAAASLEDHVI